MTSQSEYYDSQESAVGTNTLTYNQGNSSVAARNGGNSTLDGILVEIKNMEAELLPVLQYITQNIDETFNAVSDCVVGLGSTLIESGLFDDKTNGKIALVCGIGELMVSITSTYKKNREHNQMLDKMLLVKQRYAKEKAEKFQRFAPRMEHALEIAYKIFDKRINEVYQLNQIYDPQKGVNEDLAVLVMREAMALKSAMYYNLVVNYLIAEFDAWLAGHQYSSIARPCMHDVNERLYIHLYGHKDPLDVLRLMCFDSSTQSICAPQLLLLVDDQLASFALQSAVMVKDPEKEGEMKPEMSLLFPYFGLGDDYTFHPMVEKLLEKNDGYKACEEGVFDYAVMSTKKVHFWSNFLLLLSLAVDIYVFFFWLGDTMATWLQWTLFIIVGLFIMSKWSDKHEKEDEKKQACLNEITVNWANKMLDISGYQEYNTDHLDRKSMLKSAGNFIRNLFNAN